MIVLHEQRKTVAAVALLAMALSCNLLKTRRHRMPSASMEPTIAKDSIVYSRILSESEKQAVSRGDIVVFVPPLD